MSLPPALRDLVLSGPLAHLSTVEEDGAPQVSVIWIGLDGDEIVSGHLQLNRKLRNLQRDPRYVLSFEGPRSPGGFLAPYATVRGTATVTEGGAWPLLDRLAKVYMSGDATFPAPASSGGYVVRYGVERVGGVGPWVAANH